MDGIERAMKANVLEQGGWTLGRLIDALDDIQKRAEPSDAPTVCFDFCYRTPTTVHSYRGVYAFLAIGHGEAEMNLPAFLDLLRAADGETFEGYKGGDYTMDRNTPIFVDNTSDASGTAVVGVENEKYRVVIRTRYIDFA